MSDYIVLYNPKSHDFQGQERAMELKNVLLGASLDFKDITELNLKEFVSTITQDDKLLIAGGDGTLNVFVNECDCDNIDFPVFYYPVGTGNDFYFCVTGSKVPDRVIQINTYLKSLPTAKVNGQEMKFLNGVGYGIDGYCCEVAEERKRKALKQKSYSSIAIEGVLGKYNTRNAVVVVDGKEYKYNDVWLCACMNGKCYGGGMIPTPDQDRFDPEHKLSILIFRGRSRIGTLMRFPKIFKGEHIKDKKHCIVLTGNNISVAYDIPVSCQVDGEVFSAISEISVSKNK